MINILFVCHGNICRSPTAEFILRAMVRRAGLDGRFSIASAATSDEELGNSVYPPARRLLAEHGIDCASKHARQIRADDYAAYDLIIGMDGENLNNLRRFFRGDPDGKVKNLLDYAGRIGEEIADPWYTRDFQRAWADIEAGCRALLAALVEDVTVDLSGCADVPALYARLRDALLFESWYGDNLDALYDVLTGLPHLGERFRFILPNSDAPESVRDYAGKIVRVFEDAGAVIY